jgi:hypothetical protein
MDNTAAFQPSERPEALSFPLRQPSTHCGEGQAVRIATGQLAGLEGIVVSVSPGGQCLIQIRELGPGVLVNLSGRNLVRS